MRFWVVFIAVCGLAVGTLSALIYVKYEREKHAARECRSFVGMEYLGCKELLIDLARYGDD